MRLDGYISDLLFRYECVTIPDFGAFITQTISAEIDLESNSLFPPKKVLSFNEQIKKNDGLLANYIAEVEEISFEQANQKIAGAVDIIKSTLKKGEAHRFKNIGTITFNSDQRIVFQPIYELNYLTTSFGLSEFKSLPVARTAFKGNVVKAEKTIPITTYSKKQSKPYLKYAAVALIALTIGGFSASNYYVNEIKTHNQLAQEKANQQLESKIQEATFTLNPLEPITVDVIKKEVPKGHFHIVAGAFRVKANCFKKISQLKAKGYNARAIGVNKYGLHQVVYSSHTSSDEALNMLHEIRKNDNRDAWLLIKKLD